MKPSEINFLKMSSEGQHISSCSNLATFALEIALLAERVSLSVNINKRVIGIVGCTYWKETFFLGLMEVVDEMKSALRQWKKALPQLSKQTVRLSKARMKAGLGSWVMETLQFSRSSTYLRERIFAIEFW